MLFKTVTAWIEKRTALPEPEEKPWTILVVDNYRPKTDMQVPKGLPPSVRLKISSKKPLSFWERAGLKHWRRPRRRRR